VIFETLSDKHFDLLFEFELENRQWFESLISTRGDHFYTYSGVKKHILDSALLAESGTHYSAVLIVNNTIVARGNLKKIDTENNSCSVGYRVAEQYAGKGYASYCLGELIRIAKNSYFISKVEAKVLDNNPASIAVLKKQGFNILYHEPNFTELNGNQMGCTTFECLPA
jgi:ribosomal-protein-alanine N-acetyltransferase